MKFPRKNRPHGSIVAVGGGEEKFDKPDILQRFVAEAGGAEARIAILPTASAIPAERVDLLSGRLHPDRRGRGVSAADRDPR